MDELMYVKTNDNITTGSSIMPQKKNFDVMELIRARSKIVLANSFAIKNIISDLVSGYNRDTQEVKEPLIKSFVIVKETIQTLKVVFANIEFDEEAIKKHLSRGIFATDLAYKLVKQNYSFREAYKIASQKIEELEVKDNIIQESIKNRISEGSPATIDLKKYEKKIKEEKTTLKAKSDTFKECMKKLLEG
jgi:argininosuccinate lyase